MTTLAVLIALASVAAIVTVSVRYGYLNNHSNVGVYDYDRHIVGAFVTLRFPK